MSTPQPELPFATQRLVLMAQVLGVIVAAVAFAIVLQQNGGKGLADEAIPVLDTMVVVVAVLGVGSAMMMRGVLMRAAERQQGPALRMARFRAKLVQIAMLEGCCLFALTVWMLNGNAVPSLVTALVVLSIAIAVLPFSDPDAR